MPSSRRITLGSWTLPWIASPEIGSGAGNVRLKTGDAAVKVERSARARMSMVNAMLSSNCFDVQRLVASRAEERFRSVEKVDGALFMLPCGCFQPVKADCRRQALDPIEIVVAMIDREKARAIPCV